MLNENLLTELILERAQNYPERPAIVAADGQITPYQKIAKADLLSKERTQ